MGCHIRHHATTANLRECARSLLRSATTSTRRSAEQSATDRWMLGRRRRSLRRLREHCKRDLVACSRSTVEASRSASTALATSFWRAHERPPV